MKTMTKFIYSALAIVIVAMGAATANGAPGDLFVSINGTGDNGGGFIFQYTPDGLHTAFASGVSEPRGVAFDGVGNLFVANNFCDNFGCHPTILKITPDGVQSMFGTIAGRDVFAEALVFDSLGNLFVVAFDEMSPSSPSTIYKFTPSGIQSVFGSLPGQGIGLAFDSSGNLFATVSYLAAPGEIWKFLPDGTHSIFATSPEFGWDDLAFDRFGYLFVSYGPETGPGSDSILKYAPDGTHSTFATGLNFPRGLAFDRGGNLFVAEIRQDGPGDILKFTPDGNMTVFASAIGPGPNGGPEFLAFQLRPTPRPRPSPHPRPMQQPHIRQP